MDISGYTDITDTIEFAEQCNYYQVIAPVAGRYTFTLKEYQDLSYGMYNGNGDRIAQDWGIWQENTSSGATSIDLEAGDCFYLTVGQHPYDTKAGAYHFTITYPKEAEAFLLASDDTSSEVTSGAEAVADSSKTYDELVAENKVLKAENEKLQGELEEVTSKYNLLKSILEDVGVEAEG